LFLFFFQEQKHDDMCKRIEIENKRDADQTSAVHVLKFDRTMEDIARSAQQSQASPPLFSSSSSLSRHFRCHHRRRRRQ
jgi:hypothetical protein